MISKAFFWIAGVGLLAIYTSALSAQEAQPHVEVGPDNTLVIRSHPGIPERAVRYLAEVGNPTWVSVVPDEDVQPHIIKKCGHAHPVYNDLVRNRNAFVGPDLKAREAAELTLPACVYFEQDVTTIVSEDTPVTEFLRTETGYADEITVVRFMDLNPELKDGPDPSVIPAGTQARLDYRSSWRTISLKENLALSPAASLRRLRTILRQSLGADKGDSVLAAKAVYGSVLRPIPAGAVLSGGTQCQAPATAWPFDTAKLLTALERTTLKANNANRKIGEGRIAILDSNFVEPPKDPFTWNRLATAEGAPSDPGYYGIDAATQGNVPISFVDIADADHGTMVATLALGGMDFIRSDSQSLSKVRVRLDSVVEVLAVGEGPAGSRTTRVHEAAVQYGLEDAIKHRAHIVNMSFQFPQPLNIVDATLRSNPGLLVVAAAGNQRENLSSLARWPASFGGASGDLASRVITVGASSAEGITDFSAHSSLKVDILAPGCSVPALKLDLSPHSDNGTSFAAPVVSFTAGLIRQFGVTSPRAIKQRILASADVKPELAPFVWSSGVVNPAKALELYHDYFEIEGQLAPLRGTVHWNSLDSWICDGVQLTDLYRVIKIAKLGPAKTTNYLVMWRAPDGSLQKCKADLTAESVDFTEEGKAPGQLLLGQVREFVARHF